MNIVDTNGISHIFTNNISLQEDYFLVPDVAEEVEMTELVHGKRIPDRVLEITQGDKFDQAIYLDHYNKTLNKYGGRSFYNMTGFGDVSIIATVHMLMDIFANQKQQQLFNTSERVVVYTGDTRLTANINTEFDGKDVVVLPVTDIN
jgi:hypothetical protein